MKKEIAVKKTALVLWGATDLGPPHFSADILWRTGFKAPDPFVLVEIPDGKSFLLVGSLELERAAKECKPEIEVVNIYDYESKSRGYLTNFLKKHGVKNVILPDTFPCGIKDKLAKSFKVVAAPPPFYPKRAIKTDWEVAEIEKAQRAVENAVGKAVEFLRECQISGDRVIAVHHELGERTVTSELLRKIIDDELFRKGFLGIDTIIACGLQASDPHCVGFGPLLAHQPIVMDVFPCSMKTHFYADMTRTIIKGEPSELLEDMYEEVLFTQQWAINRVRDGASGVEIYNGVLKHFDAVGYCTNIKTRPMEGFIHGVGHGVGLDIHEPPRINSSGSLLSEGNVVTVEPGLYYQNGIEPSFLLSKKGIPVGGIRIEDMVLVTKTGCRNLTQFHKDLDSMIIP